MEYFEEYKTEGLLDCQKSAKQTMASEVIKPQLELGTPISEPSISQTSKTPIVLSFKTEESHNEDVHTCLTTDVKDTKSETVFCICCLKEDVLYIRLVNCEHAEFLYSMVMPEIKPKNQVICYHCHHKLKKIKLFKLQVEESFKLLSDSLETIPKRPNQIQNYKIRQIFNINIPQKGKNMEPVRVYKEVPQLRIKSNKDNDDNIKEEIIESIDETEKRPNPRSPDKQTKKSKNIEEALKIINNNQNSDCINILTNSLKNISSTLLSDFLINFDLGSEINKTKIAETIEENNITTTLKEEIIESKEKTADYIIDASNMTSKFTTENLAKFLGENASKPDTKNKAISQGNLTSKIVEALMDDSIKVSTNSEKNSKNSINKTTSTVISTDNLANNTEENSLIDPTYNYSKNKHLTSEDIGKGLLLPKVNPYLKLADKTTEKLVQNDDVGITDEIIGRVITEHYSMVENDSGGDSSQPGTDEESVGAEKEELGSGDIVQAAESTKALNMLPSLDSNIKQLTLTRKAVMGERANIANSQAYLRAPHRCASCLIGFEFQENLEDHIKRKHIKGKRQSVECDICHQFVDLGSSYEFHKFWHHTRYLCVVCDQLFSSYDTAAFHFRKQHVKRQNHKQAVVFRCPRCTYKTSRHRLLKHHMTGCRPASTDVTLETSLTNTTEAPSEAKRAKISTIA